MIKKALAITATLFLAVGAIACSSSSSDAAIDSYTCPAVGSKACPNDEATTQAEADSCNKCLSPAKDYAKCANANGASISTSPNCGSDGKSQAGTQPSADVQAKIDSACKTQFDAYTSCLVGGTSTDGGT